MISNDFGKFHTAWFSAHQTMAAGKTFTNGDISSIFDDLEDYSLQSVLAAMKHHRKTSKYAPTAYNIITLLSFKDRRISADEAWAARPKSEDDTVVWTQEAAEAYAIAYDIICEGDKIAARMAFKGAYERLCSESALMQRPVKWSASIGYDKSKIEPALMKAVAAGRITQDRANKYLPAPEESGLIAGLISGKVTELPTNNENLRRRWGELSGALQAGQARMAEEEKQRVIDAENRRFEFEQKRQAQLDAVEMKLHGARH